MQINIKLPDGARKEEMKAFGHGPLDGNWRITRLKKKDEETLGHEGYLMHWLIDKIGDGTSVTIKEIRRFAKKNPEEFIRKFNLWKGEVKLNAGKYNLVDKKAEAVVISLVITEIILLIVSIIFIVIGNIYGAISLILCIAAIISPAFVNGGNFTSRGSSGGFGGGGFSSGGGGGAGGF